MGSHYFLLGKQIQGKHEGQQHIHQSRKNRRRRSPCHRKDPAALIVDKGRDFINQQVGIDGVFRQDNIIPLRETNGIGPPVPDFLGVPRNIADKLLAGFPQARNHHKNDGKQETKHQCGAEREAYGSGKLPGRFPEYPVPAALQRLEYHIDEERNAAAEQERRKQRKHLAAALGHSLQIEKRPHKENQQQRHPDDVPDNAFVGHSAIPAVGIAAPVFGSIL